MTEACQKDFMLVGQGWSGDSAQEATRLGCKLASVPTYSVSASFANADLMVQPVPNPIDYTPVEIAAAMQKKFPEQIKKSAVMFANYASTLDTKDKVLASYPKFGFKFLDCPQQYNIAGESDWKPFVQRLQDCGAEVVYFTGSPAPELRERPRCRRPARLQADLDHRRQLLRRGLRQVEHERQRRQRLRAPGVHPPRGGLGRTRPPSSTSTSSTRPVT